MRPPSPNEESLQTSTSSNATATITSSGYRFSEPANNLDKLEYKSGGEDYYLGLRQSNASSSSPAYLSDSTSATSSSRFTAIRDMTGTNSPFKSSPWHHQSNLSLSTALLPAGTGLIDSFSRKEGHVLALTTGPNGLLYTGSDSKNIRVWKDGRDYTGFKSTSGLVKSIILDQNGRVLTGHQDGKIRIWKPSSRRPTVYKLVMCLPRLQDLIKNSLPGKKNNTGAKGPIRHTDVISCLSLNEDMSLIYSGSWDRTIKTWLVDKWTCVDSVRAHEDTVNAIAAGFNALIFSGSADGTIKMWKRETHGKKFNHRLVHILVKQDGAINTLIICTGTVGTTGTKKGLLYAGLSNGTIMCWKQQNGWEGEPEILQGHNGAVLCVAGPETGSLVFTGSADNTIRVWRRDEINSGPHVCLSVLTGHEGPVKCLAAVEDQVDIGFEDEDEDPTRYWILYSGGLDKSIKIWRVADPGEAPFDCF
ncbi:hypothetical protein LUZ60_013484 [Juncus effusus]|nr:hypothetical protein LUZ60_013484 [Juncus effusus]